jgi:hypothetical protein
MLALIPLASATDAIDAWGSSAKRDNSCLEFIRMLAPTAFARVSSLAGVSELCTCVHQKFVDTSILVQLRQFKVSSPDGYGHPALIPCTPPRHGRCALRLPDVWWRAGGGLAAPF